MYKRFILAAVLSFAIVAISIGDEVIKKKKPQEQKYKDIASQVKLFGEVYREVGRRYVDELDVKDFMRAGIDGMLGDLDPYTVFFDPAEQESIQMLTKGEYGGVGIEIGLRGDDKELTVVAPMSDSPAARKGLRSGDVIIAVDGKSTAGFTTADAAKHIKGPSGTEVTLTIRRASAKAPLDYTLVRENIQIHDIAYSGMLDEEIAYVKLTRFSKNAGNDLEQILKDLIKNEDPKGLILDLRSNPGGLLPAAVKVSEQFLQKKEIIVSTKGRIKQANREFRTRRDPVAGDIPLIVLINRGSASASEIVSGAIQDLDRGVILGTQSFGKGLVQTVINLNNGNAVKITTARYYTPSGRLIQKIKYDQDSDEPEMLTGLEKIPEPGEVDTTAERFSTRAGREVYGGGGITPDLTIKPKLMNPMSVELYRQDLFFNFIDNWLAVEGRPDTVIVTDDMMTAFNDFLDEKEFEYPIKGMDELNTLRQLGEKDSLNEDYFKLIDNLEAELSVENEDLEPEVQDFIYQNLDRQLASALGGREWRIRSTFDEDTVLTVAIDILRDQERYHSMLQAHTSTDADDVTD
ncbi:MAG: S41 family peptidase [Calditrichaeota bacterium]|nr:S41 family peptidase [Calditrichota bacterium]MBT7787584.1 S41 family peptidase [Calditrichota bacterium]